MIGIGHSIPGSNAFVAAAYIEQLVSVAPATLPPDGSGTVGIEGPIPIEGGNVDHVPQYVAVGVTPFTPYNNVPINTDKPFRTISYKRFIDGALVFEANNESAIGGAEVSRYGLQTSHTPEGLHRTEFTAHHDDGTETKFVFSHVVVAGS